MARMANCAILGYVDDVCRHVVSMNEPFHGKIMVLMGFRPMCPKGLCAGVVDACMPSFSIRILLPPSGGGYCSYYRIDLGIGQNTYPRWFEESRASSRRERVYSDGARLVLSVLGFVALQVPGRCS